MKRKLINYLLRKFDFPIPHVQVSLAGSRTPVPFVTVSLGSRFGGMDLHSFPVKDGVTLDMAIHRAMMFADGVCGHTGAALSRRGLDAYVEEVRGEDGKLAFQLITP